MKIEITKFPRYGIGWACWDVSASVPGIHPRILAHGLTKHRARNFIERVNRLLNCQEVNRVPDGQQLTIVGRAGIGHGHCRLVWDVERKASLAVLTDSLTRQAARRRRDELNPIIDAIRELRFSATVVDRFKKDVSENTLLLSRGAGPAVQALRKVIDELERQILRLECGASLENGRAA